jgi:hypothetical protein
VRLSGDACLLTGFGVAAAAIGLLIAVAVCLRFRDDTDGRRKRAAGKSRKEALRCVKRRLSDIAYRQLVHDATAVMVAWRTTGGRSRIQRDRLKPRHRHFGSVTTQALQRRGHLENKINLTREEPLAIQAPHERSGPLTEPGDCDKVGNVR